MILIAMKENSNQSFIAVAIFTKGIGVAIFSGSDLLSFETKSYRRFRSELNDFLSWFDVGYAVLRGLSRNQRGWPSAVRKFDLVAREIAELAVPVKLFPPSGFEYRPTKHEIGVSTKYPINLFSLYPELGRYEAPSTASQREYYRPLLAAVTTGVEWLRRETN